MIKDEVIYQIGLNQNVHNKTKKNMDTYPRVSKLFSDKYVPEVIFFWDFEID